MSCTRNWQRVEDVKSVENWQNVGIGLCEDGSIFKLLLQTQELKKSSSINVKTEIDSRDVKEGMTSIHNFNQKFGL